MTLAAGAKFGPYVIESMLGAGGMGEVYAARDSRLERRVAIKILPAHLSYNADLRARFEQEAKSISALQHPNICVIHDIGSQDGVEYMVMEYVDGSAMDKLIGRTGLPVEVALRYATQVADAMACAHAAGIVHRDLKPGNLMVDKTGLVKVLDFGLAKSSVMANSAAAETLTVGTTPGTIVGTVAYMSPEQAEGKAVDARSDIFSFGSVFYEMLSGRRAFEGDSSAALLASVLRDEPKSLSELKPDTPPEVRRIATRCLQKKPEKRYLDGAELARDLKLCREKLYPESGAALTPQRVAQEVKRPRVFVPIVLVALLVAAGITMIVRRSREAKWAHEVAIPQISQFYDEGKFTAAFALATRAEKAIPGDPTLAKLWRVVSYNMTIESDPPGANISRHEYGDNSDKWEFAGQTPVHARQPRGIFLWKFEKPGYGPVVRATTALTGMFGVAPGEPVQGRVTLDPVGNIPTGMVRVSPAHYLKVLFIPGFEAAPELPLADYWIDQYEVTNKQFKVFVDAGGYSKHEYWKQDFVRDGKKLSWDEAMTLFKDSAGRPGPKDWIAGQYPAGQDNFPVSGISWFEAAAYAEFAGKSLPTIYHWNRAAGPTMAFLIVPASNFGTSGVMPVGSRHGIGPWGTNDMAGNVKEWVWNDDGAGKRYVLGGAWDEPNYMFVDPDAQSPFLRNSVIGFRCVKYIDPTAVPTVAMASVVSTRRDLSKLKPVSDELFAAYRSAYSYDKIPLRATVEKIDSNEPDWTCEKITYTAGYGNETGIAYLFLPTKGKPPFQTVLFFPGSNALLLRKFEIYSTSALDGILRSGRAVIYPIYKSTYERGDGMQEDIPNLSTQWRDHMVMWVKDVSRALDYVDTRPDLDHEKIAYFGYSWGSELGSLVPAVEPRVKTVILALGGFDFHAAAPEVDPINFASRIKQPVLMLNGRYDFFFPEESSQEPLFRALGTKKEEKKHILYETSHTIPRNELIKENLDWLDKYLGPAN